jgi:hypothetical protein
MRYTNRVRSVIYSATLGFSALSIAILGCGRALSQVIFSETFDDASSADRFHMTTVGLPISPNDPPSAGTANVYSEFGFDYSAMGASRLTQSILTATTGTPSGGGSTKGLLLAANLAGNQRSSINLYPIISGMGLPLDPTTNLPLIDGNYKMTFDFFAGVNGTGDLQEGGAGTTEFMQIGAQSNGDGQHMNGFAASKPDSDFMELNTNGDLPTSDGIVFTTRNMVPTLDSDFIPNSSEVLQNAFPRPTYLGEDRHTDVAVGDGIPDGVPDGGAPAERWSVAQVTHVDGVTTFAFNGVDVATVSFSDFGNDLGINGLPWFGYEDFYNSAAGNDSPKVAEAGGGAAVGDFNEDGIVDAADYTKWRDNLGSSLALPNESSTPGMVTVEDYEDWKDNFGATGNSGSAFDPLNASYLLVDNVVVERIASSGASATSAVPEPAACSLWIIAVSSVTICRWGRRAAASKAIIVLAAQLRA